MQETKKILSTTEDPDSILRRAEAKKEVERVARFNEEDIALANAARNDEDVDMTGAGQRIQTNRVRFNKFKHHQDHHRSGLGRIVGDMLSIGTAMAAIQAMAQGLLSTTGAFGMAASRPDPALYFEDQTHVYETEKVGRQAYVILNREVSRVRKIEADLKTVDDADMLAIIKADLNDLAESCEMRVHPLTGQYVHSLDRVLQENAHYNVPEKECRDVIGVYYLKGSTHDSRKRSVVLGDQYDQQTIEVIATDSDKVVVTARPIAPPEFHNV